MSWLGFAIVVLIFYFPGIGKGQDIQSQTFPLSPPLIGDLTFITGYLLLLFWGLLSWIVLSAVLWLLEDSAFLFFPLFKRDQFRNGFLFGMLPNLSNNFAVYIARYILVGYFLNSVFEVLQLLLGLLGASTIVQIARSIVAFILNILHWFPAITDLGMVTLSIFTLIVAYAFGREQEWREVKYHRKNQLIRKQNQTEIQII